MSIFKNAISKISLRLRRIQIIRKGLRRLGINLPAFPSGHYYSPIVDTQSVLDSDSIFIEKKVFPGIELYVEEQLDLVSELAQYYHDINFPINKSESHFYYYDNPYFSYSDAISLHLMMAHFRPSKIIEIGSGYSTACMLDTIAQYGMDCHLTSIDRDTLRLTELLNDKLLDNLDVIDRPLQEVDISLFERLGEGDMLFVDSSHISKAGSELHKIIFEILPILQSGVIIHFHDILQNFEYPREWIDEGLSYNESYLLRSFLQYNSEFKILLYLGQLQQDYPEVFEQKWPMTMHPHERYMYGAKKGTYIESILGQSLYIIKK